MKPIVQYRGEAVPFGGSALLFPVDHPNHLEGHDVSNTKMATTSKVISWDESSGRIETQNTVYYPEGFFP